MSKYRFKTFGDFILEVDGTKINLEEKLGKQLSNILALLLVNLHNGVSKDKLIATYWIDSDNPTNALKFAIYRLRNTLNELNIFEDELIKNTKSGYIINRLLDVSVDTNYLDHIELNDDTLYLKKAIEIYDSFLKNYDSEWIVYLRFHYQNIFCECVRALIDKAYNNKDFLEVISVAKKALKYSTNYEDIFAYYLFALIKLKYFDEADIFYNRLSDKYKNVLKRDIPNEIKKIYSGEIEGQLDEYIKKHTMQCGRINTILSGPMAVDNEAFKIIVNHSIRYGVRNNTAVTVIIFDLSSSNDSEKYINALISIFNTSLRITDTYTLLNNHRIALLTELKCDDDERIILGRIKERFHKKINEELCQLEYHTFSLITNKR